jgi:hypothetical protein
MVQVFISTAENTERRRKLLRRPVIQLITVANLIMKQAPQGSMYLIEQNTTKKGNSASSFINAGSGSESWSINGANFFDALEKDYGMHYRAIGKHTEHH